LNPAIAIGLGIWKSLNDSDFSDMRYSYVFIIGPLIGGAIAAIVYRFLYREFEEKRFNPKIKTEEDHHRE